ncbi:MAG: hypothetical protein RLP44_09395 [Aggregatilineales bacterium]
MRKSTVFSFMLSLFVLGFVMIAPSFAQDDTLTYGDTVTGEITNETYEVPYTFEGTAGDIILVEMTMLEDGLDSYIQLKNASGEIIAFNDDGGTGVNSVMGPFILPADGMYTIVATRFMQAEGSSTGAYELTLSQTEITMLTLDETVNLTLDAQQTRASYMVSNSGTNILHLAGTTTMTENNAPQISFEVTRAEGNWITSASIDQEGNISIDPLYLTETGNYLINVTREPYYNNAEGEIQPIESPVDVSFTLGAVNAQPIEIGDTVTGGVSIGESAYYTFTADTGTIIRLTGDQPAGETPYEVMIFSDNGSQFAGAGIPYDGSVNSFVNDPIRLDFGSNFLMVVRQVMYGMEPAEGVSNYNVTLSLTESPTLQSGVEVSGTVGGDTYENVYRFEGLGGQLIRVTLTSASQNYAPGLSIDGNRPEDAEETGFWGYIGNINTTLPGSASLEVMLPEDGVYLFHVTNGRSSNTGTLVGNYRLLVEVVQ